MEGVQIDKTTVLTKYSSWVGLVGIEVFSFESLKVLEEVSLKISQYVSQRDCLNISGIWQKQQQ